MRVLVINLDSASARLDRMSKITAATGLQFERISALDGRASINLAAINRHRSPWVTQGCISNTDMACALSHRAAWRNLLDSHDDWVAVFEDDVHFGKDIAAVCDAQWIPPGVELVKLETLGRPHAKLGASAIATVGERRLFRLGGSHLGAAGYLISRRAATHLMRFTEVMEKPVDSIMFDHRCDLMHTMAVHQLVPAACIQEQALAHLECRQDALPSDMVRTSFERDGVLASWSRRIKRKLTNVAARFDRSRTPPERLMSSAVVPFD